MYLLSQTKNGISALELGRQLGVNDNTAWLLKHKLMQAMRERDRAYRLGGTVQVDDAYLGGENPGGKRGRGSENKTPMLVAVQVTDEGQPVRLKLSVVHTDGLGCFRGVEAAGCEHKPRVTGGGKAGCEVPGLLRVNTILGNVKRSLDGTYHHFEAHYATRYLAEFQYRFNRHYDLAAMLQRLLQAAATALPLPRPILCSSVASRNWPPWTVRHPRCVCNGASGRPHARGKTTQGARPRALPPATPASLAYGHFHCLTGPPVTKQPKIPPLPAVYGDAASRESGILISYLILPPEWI